jgi:protein-S-isoprenylcysteine O-methyltransferase Ste14
MGRVNDGEAQTLALVLRVLLNGVVTTVLFGLPLFLAADSFKFWNAWVFLAVFVIGLVAILVYFAFTNPQYASKRSRAAERDRTQRVVMSLLVFCALAMLVVSGLNFRFRWTGIPIFWVVFSSAIMAGALSFVFVAMRQNSFASRVIEIQQGQRLIDTGTYSVVRHPMYLGFSLLFGIAPIVLGSVYSLIPALCIPFLLTFRIRNEEHLLKNGLAGYDSYAARVKYRLIPFIW